MTSSVSKVSESKLKLKDAEGDPLKQLELLESSTCYQAIGVFSLYNELETVGELQMQHVQHISMRGHIKDFTANREGKVIAIDKLLAGAFPRIPLLHRYGGGWRSLYHCGHKLKVARCTSISCIHMCCSTSSRTVGRWSRTRSQ